MSAVCQMQDMLVTDAALEYVDWRVIVRKNLLFAEKTLECTKKFEKILNFIFQSV